MKILIVSSFFPPENSIASLRSYSWAKWWSRDGHDVTVLTTVKNIEKHNLKCDCHNFKIIEETLILPFRGISKEAKEVHSTDVLEKKLSMRQKILISLRRKYIAFIQKTGCFYACRFPDWHDRWAKKVLKKVSDQYWDIIVSTAGPYSVHYIGYKLKKKGMCGQWIVDWRDLWTKNHLYQGLKLFHPYEQYLEKLYNNNASLVTTVSEGLAETLQQDNVQNVAIIYNGYDPEDFQLLLKQPRKKNTRFTIAYCGSIYKGFRDPTPLFKAINSLHTDNLITPQDVQIVFAGVNADVSDIAKYFSVELYYTYLGFLPREQALQLEYDSDAVLFLEYENPKKPVKGILTGKLFEYLYIAREIIAIGCSNKTATGKLIEDANVGICFGNDIERIKKYVSESIKKEKIIQEKNMKVIENYTREKQAKKMLELLSCG